MDHPFKDMHFMTSLSGSLPIVMRVHALFYLQAVWDMDSCQVNRKQKQRFCRGPHL